MTKIYVSYAVAALFCSAVVADYAANPLIKFAADLDCTSCIRGGFDYCIYGTTSTIGTSWNCTMGTTPEFLIPNGGSVPSGYICSRAMEDQMAAIIGGCRPAINNPKNTCGDYLVDLNTQSIDARQLQNLPLNSTCTYRVFSQCGYPAAQISVPNPLLVNDFDVVYAAADMNADKDLASDFLFNDTTTWSGSYNTAADTATKQLSYGFSQPQVDTAVLTKCNDKPRNLWISVTRVKVTTAEPAQEFLAARQLQGVKQYAIELGFTNIQGGNAKLLGAISFALFAVLSVFAF